MPTRTRQPDQSQSAPEPPTGARGEAKRRVILDAAERIFLAHGYLGTNMDELAAESQVSKQTVYKHFGSKEALFVELVTSMSRSAGDPIWAELADPTDRDGVRTLLETYAERQLDVVLTPRLLQLRRLVIGEVARFPDLAAALNAGGPQRAITGLGELFARLTERGLLTAHDPVVAAGLYNWLIMGGPVNEAMLLGDQAVPTQKARRSHVREAVRVFLAGYGN